MGQDFVGRGPGGYGPGGHGPYGYGRCESGRNARAQKVGKQKAGKRTKMPLWQELPLLLIVGFCAAVIVRTFVAQAFFIPSGSMEHTLDIGDRVLVNKLVYDMRSPQRGEIIVFRGTDKWAPEHQDSPSTGAGGKVVRAITDAFGMARPGEKDFIKRIIGLPGDRVGCCDDAGRVTVNGYPLDEPYVVDNSPLDLPPSPDACVSRRFGPVSVPAGQVFVMGDHRAVSQDSRCAGPVPIGNVIGRAFALAWPSSRWARLTIPPTFARVPPPAVASGWGVGPVGPGRVPAAPAVPALVLGLSTAVATLLPARSARTRPRRRTLAQ